jgi:alpha-beta hydrolase superfamily lysophospholipase
MDSDARLGSTSSGVTHPPKAPPIEALDDVHRDDVHRRDVHRDDVHRSDVHRDDVHRGIVGPQLWTSDGIRLATRCWLAPGPARAAIVIAHGLTASKDEPRVVSLASALQEDGYMVIAYDARGHGESDGESTLGDCEHRDVAAVVEWASKQSARVVLVGASMGAVAVLSYAARSSVAAGVVAVSSPADWRLPLRLRSILIVAMARTRVGRAFALRRTNARIGPWTAPDPPRVLIDRVACPLAVVHGRRDPIIPARMGLGRVVRAGPARSVALVPAMGHAFDPAGHGQITKSVAWVLDQHRRASGSWRPSDGLST